MADIKQAAKWMQEGHKVRRPWLAGHISLGITTSVMFPNWIMVFEYGLPARDNRTAGFDDKDLLADDWEIAPNHSV